jgi:hypothetical protein
VVDADLAEEKVTKEIAVAEVSVDLLDPLVLPDLLAWMVPLEPPAQMVQMDHLVPRDK